MIDPHDYGHLNRELLDEAVGSEELPDSAQLVFDVENSPVKPKMDKKKRLMYAVIGMAGLLGIGMGVSNWQKHSAPVTPPASNDIDLAIAATPKMEPSLAAPSVEEVPVMEIPASGTFAAQTIRGVENKPLPSVVAPLPSLLSPTSSIAPVPPDHKAPATLTLTKIDENHPSSIVAEQQARPSKPAVEKKLAKRVEPLASDLIVVRNKQIQSLPMRNLGVVAILTDGLIIKRGDEDVEVAIGEVMPGLGVLQKTNPKDRTIETDQRIYKVN